MSEKELLSKYKGTRNVYMRSINNCERETLEIIDCFHSGDENQVTKLLSSKASLSDKLIKVWEFDDRILQLLNQDDSEAELENILVRDDKIHELIIKIERCIFESTHESINPPSTVSINSSTTSNDVRVKLPELKISVFQGDITSWQGFWDQFEAAIHSNTSISDIDKFQYLKSFLCVSVQASVNGLSLYSSNYNEAVELLKHRYGNTQMLINAHMKKFVQLPVKKNNNDINGLRLKNRVRIKRKVNFVGKS